MFLVNHIIDLLEMPILVPRQPVKLTVTNQDVVEGYGVRAAHEIPSHTLVLKFTGKSVALSLCTACPTASIETARYPI